ncbi:MAG TPA: GNAT family N-acetyltransferase [Actinomycetota bacterium]|nr:GNAT family N-acetyltransferase [Actinomycetota bacterium]
MKEAVRDRYATHARQMPDSPDGTPPTLGLGDPVSLANLRPGETVLDLGSGPGRDLLAAAQVVGPHGRAIGVDMTPEMVARARLAAAGAANVSVLQGDLEQLPVHCGAVDVVISNCVINLVPDKRRALVEAYRALRPGGRLAILDTAFDADPGADVRADADSWSCCVAGALVADDYQQTLRSIGFEEVRLRMLDAECGEGACSADGGPTARAVAVTATKPGTPSEGPVMRPAVPADLDGIATLLHEAGLSPSGLRIEDAIVAVEGGHLVGVVAVERLGRSALLRSLAVAGAHRGRGIGTRLVIAALEVARWSGADEVNALTAGETALFEKFGFKVVATKPAGFACATEGSIGADCECAVALRLSFEDADLPLLGKPSQKPLPTFEGNACC